jgi:hypothetical protein
MHFMTFLPSQHEIGADGQGFDKTEILVDDRDACVAGFGWRIESDFLSRDFDRSFVMRVNATENFDQRRFSRAVLPQQSVHFAGKDFQIDAAQGAHPAEAFGHAFARAPGALARSGPSHSRPARSRRPRAKAGR